MFSKHITTSDAFMEMPTSSQLLYFHLNMEADDEGFVGNPKRVVRMIGSNEDDLKILLAKRFLLAFESGVVVIKHWLIHNTIRMDRFNPTNYQKEKGSLYLKENKSYTDNKEHGLPVGNQMATQVKLSKVNLSKDRSLSLKSGDKEGKEKAYYKPTGEQMIFSKGKWWVIPKDGGDWSEFAGSIKNDIEWRK